jgi:uncharacterized protein (DUF305 family)
MTNRRTWWLAGALLFPLSGSACAHAAPPQAAQPTPSTQVQTRGGVSAEEFERIYRARLDSATMRFTPADAEFITHMIPHHAQAIEISLLAPKNGASPQIQTLAARIINAQKDEIRIMQTWLKDRGQPVPEVHVLMDHPAGHAMDMPAASHDDHMDMPGMLTPAQVRELEQAKGAAFDRLFLERMIDHHRGAVTMVQKLNATDGAMNDEAVFKIASDVQVDQLTEIARMELMLKAMDR